MDWTRLAGSLISGLIGSFFSDDDPETPEVEVPPFNPAMFEAAEANIEPPPPEPIQQPQIPQEPPQRSPGDWFSGLSAEAQKILGRGVAGGAAGIMQMLAQRNAQEDAREREERQREDRRRRESMPAFGRGIIATRRG